MKLSDKRNNYYFKKLFTLVVFEMQEMARTHPLICYGRARSGTFAAELHNVT